VTIGPVMADVFDEFDAYRKEELLMLQPAPYILLECITRSYRPGQDGVEPCWPGAGQSG